MILVTGGTGLVGSHVLYQLALKNENIIALVRNKKRVDIIKKVFSYYSADTSLINKIEFVEGDVLNAELLSEIMKKVNLVYHCAAVVSFDPKDADNMTKINVEGTKNIVNSALSANIKKLCYVSSTAAIGKNTTGEYNTESTPWTKDGASNYSISKYRSEQEVWKGIASGLNTVIVNPSIIIGPGDWGKSSTSLFNEVWKGLLFYTGGTNAFVDVRDVADSMISLMESNVTNERFLCVSENISFEQLFKWMAQYLGKKEPLFKATKPFTDVAWRFEKTKQLLTGKTPRITKESARSSQSIQLFSNEKIKKAINKEFISVEQSIADTAKLFLKDVG